MNERCYWIAFGLVKGIGPARFRQLLARFGTLAEAWQAPLRDLQQAGIDRRALSNIEQARKRIDPEAEQARLDKLGIATLTWDDDDYPPLLNNLRPIDQAPPLIYLRGSLAETDEWALTIVGTRSASPYGRQVAYQLAKELASRGLTIVSGMARGIDAEAHRAALEVGQRTLAVLPCGMDMIYPPEHRNLAAQIMQQGALVSIFPLGAKPTRANIAARNRAMSGLARGVLVIEAGMKSGALMTAGYALEQGRDVLAVPGNITAQGSAGTNRLIQDGAHPVLSADDVLIVLDMERAEVYTEARQSLPAMSADEQTVLDCLTLDPTHIDEMTRLTGLPIAVVSSVLITLELKGMVRQVGPMIYARAG